MPVASIHRIGPAPRLRAPRDPRLILGAVLALSLAGLALLPEVAGTVGGVALPTLGTLRGGGPAGCRVIEIVDGDTLTLACPGRPAERARLTGYDTPELSSPQCLGEKLSAMRAKRQLNLLVGGAEHLGVVRQGHDRYGRVLVALSVDGRPVAAEMIEAGLARAYDGGRRGGWCGAAPAPVARGTTAKWVQAGDAATRGTSAKWVGTGG